MEPSALKEIRISVEFVKEVMSRATPPAGEGDSDLYGPCEEGLEIFLELCRVNKVAEITAAILNMALVSPYLGNVFAGDQHWFVCRIIAPMAENPEKVKTLSHWTYPTTEIATILKNYKVVFHD